MRHDVCTVVVVLVFAGVTVVLAACTGRITKHTSADAGHGDVWGKDGGGGPGDDRPSLVEDGGTSDGEAADDAGLDSDVPDGSAADAAMDGSVADGGPGNDAAPADGGSVVQWWKSTFVGGAQSTCGGHGTWVFRFMRTIPMSDG